MGIFRFLETTTKNLVILAIGLVFLLSGLGLIALGIFSEIREHAQLAAASQTTAIVLSSSIGTEGSRGDRHYVPKIRYQYTVNRKTYISQRVYPGISAMDSGYGYASSERMVLDHPKGKKCPVWFEKDKPQIAFLVPHNSWVSIFIILFGVPFAIVGLIFTIRIVREGIRRARMMAVSRMNL